MWRLVCEGLLPLDADVLRGLSIDDIEKANSALDAYQDAQYRASKPQ